MRPVVDSEHVDATRRTRLANERTYLAWLRSAPSALAVAVGAGKIVPDVAHVTRWPFELLGEVRAVWGDLDSLRRTTVRPRRAGVTGRSVRSAPTGERDCARSARRFLAVATLALVFVR
jgi:Domain of unknown function (DUF202)